MKALKYIIPLGIVAVLCVFLGIGLTRDPRIVPSPFIGKPAPSFTLSALHDPQVTFSPEQLKGKVWLLKVWASWCPACKIEHPVLNDMSRRVYSINRNSSGFVPIKRDIQKAISQGAGFVDFEGHGNPLVWDTIWFDGSYPDDWCGGINLYNFLRLTNREKLPVVVVGGCHNGLYNVSFFKTLLDKTGEVYFSYGIPIPVCFSWGLVVRYPGGAIASTGCTGYGMGYVGNPISLSGELESNFFYQIGMGTPTLGQAHGQAIQKFLCEEDIGQVEAFVITNWALFGDPSLRFGGYLS